VFLAEDARLGRRVAIKRLSPVAVSDASARERLLVEARAAARLDHPNICGIYEVGEDSGGPFIVMPVVDGETLEARIARSRPDIRDAVAIAVQIAEALAAAHALGVLHRDIKPGNVMVSAGGRVRVMDFGLAKIVQSAEQVAAAETVAPLTAFGTWMGTAPYISPEQARCEAVDQRTDLFSLGVLMFEMVTGVSPFARASAAETVSAVLGTEPPGIEDRVPEAPPELGRIISKCLRKDRAERYQTAQDVRIDLNALLHALQGSVASSQPTRAGRVPHDARRRAGYAVGVVAVALVAVAWLRPGWIGLGRAADGRPPVASLVVLPFANDSGSGDYDYIADGLTHTILEAFATLPGLMVISTDTAFRFKSLSEDPLAVAGRLQVASVLVGSVQAVDGLLLCRQLSDIGPEFRFRISENLLVFHRHIRKLQ
jgi:serine/threonine-protein kinase